jgi:hypothetical protein
MRRYEVIFQAQFRAVVRLDPGDALNDAIHEIDIPQTETCRYVEDSTEVVRAHRIADRNSEVFYEVFFEARFKTWLEAEDSQTLEDQLFEVNIPENKDCSYQVNSVSMIGFEVAAATGGGLELRLVVDDEPVSDREKAAKDPFAKTEEEGDA